MIWWFSLALFWLFTVTTPHLIHATLMNICMKNMFICYWTEEASLSQWESLWEGGTFWQALFSTCDCHHCADASEWFLPAANSLYWSSSFVSCGIMEQNACETQNNVCSVFTLPPHRFSKKHHAAFITAAITDSSHLTHHSKPRKTQHHERLVCVCQLMRLCSMGDLSAAFMS